MHAVTITEFGGPDVLEWAEVPDPELRPGEVLVEVEASAVNRADLLQRQGHYPPPPGASHIPGLECSGRIAEIGPRVTGWQVGDEVCALLAGGGYAERVAVPAGQLLPVPKGVSVAEAAALPETTCTVWSNVFAIGRLSPGDIFLVHGGSGGIGTMAIQVAAAYGARVFATSSAAKLDRCRALGADRAIDYESEDFVAAVRGATGDYGADVVLDVIGGKYLGRNVDVLAKNGRLVVIGMQGGTRGELDLGVLMAKRASVTATTLRARSVGEKSQIVSEVREHVWPLIEAGQIVPIIDRAVAMPDAAEAHRAMEAGEQTGKILLVR